MVILLYGRDRDTLRQLTAEAYAQSQGVELQITLLPQPVSTIATMIQSARTQRPELLLLSRECPLLSDQALESLVNELDCSIVLV